MMAPDQARDTLLQHSRSKQNGCFPSQVTHRGVMLNPLCGDQVEMHVQVAAECIKAIGFRATACAICSASASLLSENAWQLSRDQFQDLKNSFETALTDQVDQPWPEKLKFAESLEHLRVNPRRRACAILPWLALAKAILF